MEVNRKTKRDTPLWVVVKQATPPWVVLVLVLAGLLDAFIAIKWHINIIYVFLPAVVIVGVAAGIYARRINR